MQVQVNTSNGIENTDTLERWANEYLQDALARFKQEITRVEVQVSRENAKGGADIRCMMEARLNGHDPLAVNHHAPTQDEAFRGAAQRRVGWLIAKNACWTANRQSSTAIGKPFAGNRRRRLRWADRPHPRKIHTTLARARILDCASVVPLRRHGDST